MWIVDLAQYIRDGNVDGVGQNVFVFILKEDDVGCMITPHTAGLTNDPCIPDLYSGGMSVIVRSANMEDAMNQCQAVSNLISSFEKRKQGLALGFTTASAQWNYLYPRHQPVVFPRTMGDFYEALVNFDVSLVALSG